MLGPRKAIRQAMLPPETSMRGLLRNVGLKVGALSRGRYEHRIREPAEDDPMLEAATSPMLRGRALLRQDLAGVERRVRRLVQDDPACRWPMSMPGVGAAVAPSHRSAVDGPPPVLEAADRSAFPTFRAGQFLVFKIPTGDVAGHPKRPGHGSA